MKKFLNEFKDFALKGNVMNLAVGVIIGAAFQSVVSSLTDNIISPIIGLFAGKNFDALQFEALGATITYGAFITSLIDFFIMALVVFIMVKSTQKMFSANKKQENAEPEPPTTKKCAYCMSEIDIQATRCPMCTSNLEA